MSANSFTANGPRGAAATIWPLFFVFLLTLGGCHTYGGDDGDAPGEEDVFPPACPGDTVMPFNPRPGVRYLPWPIDLITEEDPGTRTGRRLALNPPYPPIVDDALTNVSFVRDAAAQADGFSTTSRIFIPAGGDLDQASLPDFAESLLPGATVQLIVADPDSPRAGERVMTEVLYRPQLAHLQIKPVLPLDGATRYLVVVTGGVRDALGIPVCPSDEFAYLRRREPHPGVKYFEELEPIRLEYQEIFEFLESLPAPVERADAVVAFSFTTTDATGDMEFIGQYLIDRARVYPPRAFEMEFTPADSGNLNVEVRGRFNSPEFRDASGVFRYDPEIGGPRPEGDEPIEFLLLLPEPEDGPAAQPFPVILVIHGISDSKGIAFRLSSQLRASGFAAVATDLVGHGSRQDPDAFLDSLEFVNFGRPLVMRDNIRQSVADQLQTIQFVRTLSALDAYPYDPDTGAFGDGIPDLDTSNLMFFGHSLGSILAPMVMALSPDVNAGVTSAAAGQWTDIAEYSYQVKVIISVMNALFFDDLEFPEPTRMLFDVFNIILDPADPFNYVRRATLDPLPVAGGIKYLLLGEAIGDETLPNESTDLLALVAGAPLAMPFVQLVAGVTPRATPFEGGALVQFDVPNHAYYFSSSEFGRAARLQSRVFWESYVRDGVPLVINPFDPGQAPDWFD